MALPKRLADLIAAKEKFIADVTKKLETSVKSAQIKYFNDLVAALIEKIEVRDGQITNNPDNIKIMDALIDLHDNFSKSTLFNISKTMATNFAALQIFTDKYFATLPMDATMRAILKSATRKAKETMMYRVGISAKNGKLIKDGFLQRFVNDTTIREQIQQLTMRYVTGQGKFSEFTTKLRDFITGDGNVDGAYEKYYRQFAYDSYSEYDNAYNENIATSLEMRAFIYQGGLMENSRLFCEEHNNHVYTRDEAAEWSKWTPAKAEYHDFGNEPDANKVPGYIAKFPGYQPLINLGGFNCRHYLTWITDDMAIEMRPELQDIFAQQ